MAYSESGRAFGNNSLSREGGCYQEGDGNRKFYPMGDRGKGTVTPRMRDVPIGKISKKNAGQKGRGGGGRSGRG